MSRWFPTEVDESAERALFARRTRALGPARVPSLETVLAAAEREGEPVAGLSARAARSRALIATALAAACVVAAIARLPRTESRVRITADVDAGPRPVAVDTALAAGATCSMNDTALTAEQSACFEPARPGVVAAVVAPVSFAPPDDEGTSCQAQSACEACGSCESSAP